MAVVVLTCYVFSLLSMGGDFVFGLGSWVRPNRLDPMFKAGFLPCILEGQFWLILSLWVDPLVGLVLLV